MSLFSRVPILLRRAWGIYVAPPRETKVYQNTSGLPVLTKKVAVVKTGLEPKQVAVDEKRRLAYVSCMRGKVLQAFRYRCKNERLVLVREWPLPEQGVEVEIVGNLCFVTTTNFARGPAQRSFLVVLDLDGGTILSKTDTGGEWSKVVRVDQKSGIALISNWHSHNISVVDVSNPRKLRLRQLLPCGEAPRGIDFADGLWLVTGFYSSRVYQVRQVRGNFWVVGESPPFDSKNYQGNLRDVLIAPSGKSAWVSNLGRNMVHQYNVEEKVISSSVLVGRFPNSIRFLDPAGDILLVSCRKENRVYFVDTKRSEVKGVSEETGKAPTGLAKVKGGFLVTSFDDASLEYHRVK